MPHYSYVSYELLCFKIIIEFMNTILHTLLHININVYPYSDTYLVDSDSSVNQLISQSISQSCQTRRFSRRMLDLVHDSFVHVLLSRLNTFGFVR